MNGSNLRIFSSYEIFGYFLPGLVMILSTMLLFEDGALRDFLKLPSLITLGVLGAVVVGIGIHTVIELVERESGRTTRELFREKLGANPPDRLVVRAMDRVKNVVPLKSVEGGPYRLDPAVVRTVRRTLEDRFEFVPFESGSRGEGRPPDRDEDDAESWFVRVPIVADLDLPVPRPVHSFYEQSSTDGDRTEGTEEGLSTESGRPTEIELEAASRSSTSDPEAAGETTAGDEQPADEDGADPGADRRWDLTDEQWNKTFDLLLEDVSISGTSRALKFRAMYGFSRSMSLTLFLVATGYTLGSWASSLVSTEAILLKLLGNAPFGIEAVSVVLFAISILFAIEANRFQARYVDYLLIHLLVSGPDRTTARE